MQHADGLVSGRFDRIRHRQQARRLAIHHDEHHRLSLFPQRFRALDLAKTVRNAGFAAKKYFHSRIPNWGTVSEEEFRECVLGRRPVPPHGNGASWFIFGAER